MLGHLRHRTLPAAIAILAIMAQLLLPSLHAQSMAQRSGLSLAYLYCGTPPSMLARLSKPTRLELQSGARTLATLADASCALCASVHGSPAPVSAAPPSLQLNPAAAPQAVSLPHETLPVRLVFLPPLRAPPRRS